MQLTMPPLTNTLIETEFTVSQGPKNMKSTFLICKHCPKYNRARNTSRALEHLQNCPRYKAKQQEQASIDSTTSSQKRQRTLTVPSFPILRKRKLDSMAAMAVFIGARPFRL